MQSSEIPETTVAELVARYAALLLDAYGVLIYQDGPLPGACALVEHLNGLAKPYWIVSNDASRLTSTTAARYQAMGLDIAEHRIVNSGALLNDYFRTAGLVGARCVVLGPADSHRLVRDAGGVLVPAKVDGAFDAVVVCDEEGFSVLETLDTVLTMLVRKTRGESAHLLLPNPDLVYQQGVVDYGFTAGAIALVLEQGLERVFGPHASRRFVRLGKPHPPLFEQAIARAGTRDVVMIGDQLQTDIAGAQQVGIASAWVATGITSVRSLQSLGEDVRPTYRLRSLAL